jgi:hypothetical protein
LKRFSFVLAAALALGCTAAASAANLQFTYTELPSAAYVPDNVVTATDGTLWFDSYARVECGQSEICEPQAFGHVSRKGVISMFQFPSGGAYQSLSAGPQGTAWIVSGTGLYVFNQAGALVATYPIDAPTNELSPPVLGPDGRMWLTDFGGDLFAVTASGTVSTYACPNRCDYLAAGPNDEIWGNGLDADFNPFFFAATTTGVVTTHSGGGGSLIAGLGKLFEYEGTEVDVLDRNSFDPFADLQGLDLDEIYFVTASKSELWLTGSKGGEAQAVVATISKRGALRSEPFGNVPCQESYVYFSNLTQGPGGAMYGGFGCGDITGTHAGYLVRIKG